MGTVGPISPILLSTANENSGKTGVNWTMTTTKKHQIIQTTDNSNSKKELEMHLMDRLMYFLGMKRKKSVLDEKI